ncbi:rhodanese domain-containing protein CG4456-like [Malaya genurostris]|uniref:rhodanese domain-containing protein CG4456-like n=1 Tax=Malaya genurostris TaxID=325434 RepID=UPI0026F3AC55|nr:rhodanese domain-containing protein CG4456-like [Malaya genurostris]
MNTGRIRLLVQNLGPLRSRILVPNGSKAPRCGLKVNQFSTFFGRQIVEKNQIVPVSVTGFRQCSAKATGNKFDRRCIDASLVATYAEIVDLPKHPEKLLIDVREPEEIAAKGAIPTSINIPLRSLNNELKLSPAVFQTKYGRKKPEPTDPIIFTCCVGARSADAAYEADQQGFKNVKNYVGSWTEYAEANNLLQ